ncbi:MAG TPA: hypothetical protein VHO25_06145, partial [Polyangiaceae bacterium]|nr:hypothetical protein [Polyangiaceae bacterium]
MMRWGMGGVAALVVVGCGSANEGSGTGSVATRGCLQPGTYRPMVVRSSVNPGDCPTDEELPLEWNDLVVGPGDQACGTMHTDGTGTSGSSTGEHCSYEDVTDLTAFTIEARGTYSITVHDCTYAGGLSCTANYDVTLEQVDPNAPEDEPDGMLMEFVPDGGTSSPAQPQADADAPSETAVTDLGAECRQICSGVCIGTYFTPADLDVFLITPEANCDNLCINLQPGGPGYCTAPCETDSDCEGAAVPMVCS